MSDDEREYSDEEEQPKSRAKRSSSRGRVSRSRSEVSDSGKMSDIEEKLRKKKEEEEAMWGEYIEQRKKQRQKEEEELKKLKERQSKRKTQRAEQEKMLIEMKKKQEEQKQREIEEKKAREAEAKRKRLEDAEKKRAAMMEAMEKSKQESKPNFVINKKDQQAAAGAPGGDKFANVAFARSEMNKTKEQLAEDKEIAISIRVKPLDIEGLSVDKLKQKAAQLWDLIVQLESDKYDLEERQKRQDYDLKELNERQRQINRNKALKKGLDPEAFTGKYPPKINVANKFERRVDRRDYKDKKQLFEGGWEKMTKEEQEKWREEREKEFKDQHGETKVPKWDPTNPRNKEGYGEAEGARTYDDTDDFDVMDTFKPFTSSEPDPPPRRQSVQKPAPPPPAAEEEEEEYEEEEEEEE